MKIDRKNRFNRFRLNQRGLTLLEVTIAAVLMAVPLYVAWSVHRRSLQAQRAILDDGAIVQIEKIVSNAVIRTMHMYFNNVSPNCDAAAASPPGPLPYPGFPAFPFSIPLALPSQILLKPLSPTELGSSEFTQLANFANFGAAISRCSVAQTLNLTSNFSAKTGIYFCLSIGAVAGADGLHLSGRNTVIGSSELFARPVFVEFLYTPTHIDGGQVRCDRLVDFNPSEVLGTLFYTFYWTGNGVSGVISKSKTGFITFSHRSI